MVEQGQRAPGPGGAAADEAAPRQEEPTGGGPARDGLVGVYVERVVDRGVDLRPIINEHRATPGGAVRRVSARQGEPIRARQVGRGTAAHRAAVRAARQGTNPRPRAPRIAATWEPVGRQFDRVRVGRSYRPGRRLVAAGLAVLLLLGGGIGGAAAEEAPAQHR